MKEPGEQTLLLYDWFVPFYEKALPKKPPKIPTLQALSHAAEMAYDKNPSAVPYVFLEGRTFKGMPKKVLRELVIIAILKWAKGHAPRIERYMLEEYDVLVVFQDGDPTSKGKRIITNSERIENVRAAQTQAAWDHKHCNGTHDREDFNAEQINRLQPAAAIQRHKMINLPLPKSKFLDAAE